MTTTEALCALILPWAKEHEPEKYAATLAVIQNARTFRRYLVRLVEIRWDKETWEWRRTIPLDVLEESAITIRVRCRATNRTLEVKGRLAAPREWSFGELAVATSPDDLEFMALAKEVFDLEHVR